MTREKREELLSIEFPMELEYQWAAGPNLQRFFEELKEGTIIGNRCPQCKRILIPPVNVCGRCHVEMGDVVKLSPKGTVISYNFVVDPLFDSALGAMRPVPYTSVAIVLDGNPTATFSHILDESDPHKVTVGMRVEAVFKPPSERKGLISDIIHFRPLSDGEK